MNLNKNRFFLIVLMYCSSAFAGGDYRIVYESRLDDQLPSISQVIKKIQIQSQKNNKKNEIGGVILFNLKTREVFQVLEGEERMVKKVFNVIAQDPRHAHDSVKVIEEGRITTRSYSTWGMGLKANYYDPREWELLKSLRQAYLPGDEVILSPSEQEDLQRAQTDFSSAQLGCLGRS